MLIKSGGNLTIRTFGGLGLGGDFDDDTYRHRSNDNWVPYDEYIAIECIVAPNQLYQLLTDVAQVATVAAQLTLVGYQYLQGGLRLVREDGSCIDFNGKGLLDELLDKSKNLFDLDFLKESEGYDTTPSVKEESSGVTIGMGVDLGWQTKAGMAKILPPALYNKIEPYIGLTQDKARNKLKETPLNLTPSEIQALTDAMINDRINSMIKLYNADTKGVPFDRIPYNTRTAIIDLFYQYTAGASASNHGAPNAWGFILNNDWNGLHTELLNFGDSHTGRRKREAGLVQSDIDTNQFIYRLIK
ncbi:hypothetical protein FNA12_24735 [Salmonella enterica]|nr:hypothetical protein [Salmonella enterica]EJQ5250328.1 hypothetical protein [Salmonella enterica]EMA3693101.1 hypothetical protein [Salmonella enterica]